MNWTLLLDGAHPGWHNMAVDSALLDLADREGTAFLRLYRWEPFCLSFGRHEPASRRYDRSRIAELGLDCVRRPTGGRAVWHARELTYAVAAPLAEFGGLREAYHRIHSLIALAIRSLGIEPDLAPSSARAAHPSAGPCFATPVGGEILVRGRKLVGSAQLRQGNAFLQHGSLLLDDNQSLPRSLAGLDPDEEAEVPLAQLSGRPVSFEEVACAVIQVAHSRLTPQAGKLERKLPEAVLPGVEQHAARFQDPAWTWQR